MDQQDFDTTRPWVSLPGRVVRETPRAILFLDEESGRQCWLPKSQIAEENGQALEAGHDVDLMIYEWIAVENDLI